MARLVAAFRSVHGVTIMETVAPCIATLHRPLLRRLAEPANFRSGARALLKTFFAPSTGQHCPTKLGSFCNTCVTVVYFSPRLLCRFDLVVRAISIRRRIASDRVGLSLWCLAQVSIADLRSIGSRMVRVGSCPVAGRPRPRFFCVTGIDSLPILCDT